MLDAADDLFSWVIEAPKSGVSFLVLSFILIDAGIGAVFVVLLGRRLMAGYQKRKKAGPPEEGDPAKTT